MYRIACEVEPGSIGYSYSLKKAIQLAEREAEDYYYAAGSSQYMVVKNENETTMYAVRYTPDNGGTLHADADLDEMARIIISKENEG